MVKIALQISANLENLTDLRPDDADSFKWFVKFKCSSCGEVPDHWQHVCLVDRHEVKGGRGHANAVIKCKLCGRENSCDIYRDSLDSYNYGDNDRFKSVVAFDCRGMEPVEFDPRDGWAAKGFIVDEEDEEENKESGKVFDEVDLSSKEWADYDDVSGESVYLSDVKYQFIKVK